MNSPLTKKRLHESTTSLFEVSENKKLRRTTSVPQVVLSENDLVAKALLQLKTSIDKNEKMAQWFKRCEKQSSRDTECAFDSSTGSSCCSLDDEPTHDSSSILTPLATRIPDHLEHSFRTKLLKKPSNPDEFVQTLLLLKGKTVQCVSASSLSASGYFPKITDDFVRGYTMEVVTAVRNDDVATLRRMHEENPTRSLLCGSKFGDSIIHLACRRNRVKVLEFLLTEMDLSPQLICDNGRTPLHDAFWNTTLNEQVLTLLLNKCPHLLFVTDHRGSTPLSYTPRDQWTYVCRFLAQHIKKYGTFLSSAPSKSDKKTVHIVPIDSRPRPLLGQ